MKKVLFALLVATVCVACEKEGETTENPVTSTFTIFSPEYGQVPREEEPSPETVEGELPEEEGDTTATIVL